MFQEYIEFFSSHSDKSTHTLRSYHQSIDAFLAHFSITSLDALKLITPKDIRAYRTTLQDRGMKASSANATMRPVSAFFRWLWKQEYIEQVAFEKVESLKESHDIKYVLTDQECDALVNACKGKDNVQNQFMILLMLTTGMRRSEVVLALVDDIQNDHIIVHGKGNKDREIKLHTKVRAMFPKYMSQHPGGKTLFYAERGEETEDGRITTQTVYDRVKNICEKAGFSADKIAKVSPHTLRRTFATNILEAEGVNVFTVQDLMGHNSLNTTRRYGQVRQGSKDRAIDVSRGYGD